MTQFEAIGVTHPHDKFQFGLADLADSQTDTDLLALGSAAVVHHVAPFAGRIIGYSISHSAAVSAGNLDFEIEKNGTTIGETIAADAASTVAFRGLFKNWRNYAFNAGDTLGVTYTSDASLEPNTMDTVVTVLVVYDDARPG